jgi:hypothetical protein
LETFVTLSLVLALLLPAGCKRSDEATPSAPPSPVTPEKGARKPGTPALPLPRAEAVLPATEVVRGSVVATGDGFRFQVPPSLRPVEHPRSTAAFSGTVAGRRGSSAVTLYVVRQPHSGDLERLVQNETNDAIAHGARIALAGPASVRVAGSPTPAFQIRVERDRLFDLLVMAVHAGSAYLFHCEIPFTAWDNIGSECTLRGATLHIAPPTS